MKKVSHGIQNETAARAAGAEKAVGYLDARQDIEAALAWIRKQGYVGKLTLWGSSYSSSLALMIGARSKSVSVVLAFSPGEYLPPRGSVEKAVRKLAKPVLVVAPEGERQQAEALFKAIPSRQKQLLVGEDILHGSRTLFLVPHPQKTWKVVLAFLKKHAR